MKTFRLIVMTMLAVLMCVNFASCNEDDVRENELTITDLEGQYIGKEQHRYQIKIFDESKCWKNQEFSKEFSIESNEAFNIDITNSAVMIFPKSKFFFQIENEKPNNLCVDDYDLPWHIEKSNNCLILYRPYLDGVGYSLSIYELRRL